MRPPTVQQVEEFARAGRAHAPEEHLLLPEADERPSPLPLRRVTDWLQVCRDAARRSGAVLEELPTRRRARAARRESAKGGDETTAVDAAAEAAVVEVLEAVPAGFTLVSEELGERVFGDGGDGLTVVCDPIDGSLNAKRGIPFFSLSLAVASGRRMEDVRARLRPRLRERRGVGRAPRRGRVSERQPAGRASARRSGSRSCRWRRRGPTSSRSTSPAWSASPIARASWARWRSRSATSRPGASTRSSPSSRPGAWTSRPRSSSSASAAWRSTCRKPRRFAAAPLDLGARSRVVAAAHAGALRRAPRAPRSQ